MKTRVHFLLSILSCFIFINIYAEEQPLFQFNFRTDPIDLSAQAVYHASLSVSDFTINGTGLSNVHNVTVNWGHKGFTAKSYSPANEQFYQFTISPSNNVSIDLTKLKMTYKRAAAQSPENVKIIVSKDNFATDPIELYTNTGISNTAQIIVDNPLANQLSIASGETATVKIIPWCTAANGGGAFLFVTIEFIGNIEAPLKEAPVNHVTNFKAEVIEPTYKTIKLTWTDSDADNYLIKATPTLPINNTAYVDTIGLIKNVKKGDQTYTFNNICEGTTYTYKIYPYNNMGSKTLFKTDGEIPTASATTTQEPDVNPLSCSDGLEEVVGAADVWVKGYIRGFVRVTTPFGIYLDPPKEIIDTIPAGFHMNILIADDPAETDIKKMFYVKLSDPYIRGVLQLKDNYSNLGRNIAAKGKIANNTVGEGNHYGFGQTYSYRWLDQTAVSTLSDSNIKIYRQENTLNIDGLNTEFQVTIFNLQGIKVKEINSTDNRIDISSLLQGTYIVSISNNQFKINKKIIL
ncbi:hypothetical protein MASR2M117_04150 [Paludibacter sp.]